MNLRSRMLVALALALVAGDCFGQGTPSVAPEGGDKLPTYDVSTIRPNTSGSDNVSVSTRPATLQAENVSVRDLLYQAFGVSKKLIFGLPAWAESARFNVNAKVLDADLPRLKKLTPDQRRAMLRGLCEERFGMKWHFETRDLPAYELVLTKEGSKLKVAAGAGDNHGTSMNNSDLTATGVSLRVLTDILSVETERPVVNKTGLSGTYDFHLVWTREAGTTSTDAGKDSDAPPPLFTALQEQLGLKLESGKDPVQVVVIDQLERPTDN